MFGGYIGQKPRIYSVQNSPHIVVMFGGKLGNYMIDLRKVAAGCFALLGAALFNAPLSLVLWSVASITLWESTTKYNSQTMALVTFAVGVLFNESKNQINQLKNSASQALNQFFNGF
jgi:hypothetical protein